MNKNKDLDKEEKPLDPFQAAQREGKVFGVGLKGNYRKNKVTIIGFFLLGSYFFLAGLLIVLQAFYTRLVYKIDATTFIADYIFSLVGIVFMFLGGTMLYKVIKRDKLTQARCKE